MISDKMKPVIAILLIILCILIGIKGFQMVNKPKVQVKTAAQEMIEYWSAYMVDLQKHIRTNVSFDDNSLYADIIFNIDKTGKISDVKLTKESGNKDFDKKIVDAVINSSPCEALPQKYKGKGVTVSLTLGGEISGSQIIKEF